MDSRVISMRVACIIAMFASTVLCGVIRSPPKFICEENGYFLNPYNCSGFYLCVRGVAEWHPCPDHLHPRWESPDEVYCDIPEHVNCTALYARDEVPSYDPESAGSHDEFCSGKADGLYRDQNYCYRFAMCSSGHRLAYDCPSGMSFDEDRGICTPDQQCAYVTGYDNDDEYSGSSANDVMKFPGMRSAEVIEAKDAGSGDEDMMSAHHGYMMMDNKRVERLKNNIDSVLNQKRNEVNN